MSDTIPKNALIVVADGGKAILLRNTSAEAAISLQEVARLTPDTIGGQGPSGTRAGDQTPGETNEATFSKQIAQALVAMHNQNQFEALVLVADPQTLGQIRSALNKNVENAVVRSLSKDLTNHSAAEIEKALSK
jgi:protein required for attachment to host cells